MAGISDKALGKRDSKNKFNRGVELEEDYGVNLYSTFYRQYDPQIGRFGGVDVLSEKSITMSVYGFAGNNPVMFNDPFGNEKTLPTINEIINALDESANGGEWSSSDPGRAYLFGDELTAEFLGEMSAGGSGNENGSFFDNLAKAYNGLQAANNNGLGDVSFDISYGKNYGYTASVAGAMSDGKGESLNSINVTPYHLGFLGTGSNKLSYSGGENFYGNQKSNGWETAGTILGAADLSFESTIHGVNLAANTFRGSGVVTDLGKLGVKLGNYGKLTLETGGKILTGVGIAIPLADMAFNPNADYWSDGTDAVMGGVAFVPGVGWIISGAYFLINEGVKSATGESIGDHLGHALENPIIQNSMGNMAAMPSF